VPREKAFSQLAVPLDFPLPTTCGTFGSFLLQTEYCPSPVRLHGVRPPDDLRSSPFAVCLLISSDFHVRPDVIAPAVLRNHVSLSAFESSSVDPFFRRLYRSLNFHISQK